MRPVVPDPLPFRPGQIVCIEQGEICLYGEVIQVIEKRHRCWVRPRWLVQQQEVYPFDDRAPDLVWPLADFRAAFDLEVLPLVSEPLTPTKAAQSRQYLQQFVRTWGQALES